MEKEKKTLNNAQRKALAQLVEKTYERLIQEAKDKEGELVKEITEKVRVELGVDVIENQIKSLEEKMEELGFDRYGGLKWDSKAKALVDARVSQESREFEKERAEKIEGLWTAQTIDEAKALLKGIVK